MISSRPNLPLPAPEQVYSPPPMMQTFTDDEASGPGMSMDQVLSILRGHRRQIIVSVAALLAVSAVTIRLLPKSYEATATLIVNYGNKDVLAAREFPSAEANTYIPTQIELILSRVVLRPVVQQLNLTADPHFTNGFSGSPEAVKEVATKNLHDSITVLQGVGSQLLYISATSREPVNAANIANAIADEYLRQERQRTNEPAGERAERYSQQLAELRAKTIAAQDRLTEYRQQHGMTQTDTDRADVEGTTLADLQTKLDAAANTRRELEAHQIDAHSSSETVLNATPVISLRSRLTSQEADMADLRATLGPKHPKVIELQGQIDATRKSLADEVRAISENNSVQLAQARQLEARYKAAMDTERERLIGRRALEDQSAKLVLELQSAQATYKRALDGYDQIVFASAGDYHDVSLVSRADPPVKSEKPNKLKLFLMAIAASFALGIGWPFAYELLANRRLRCQDDLERNFGIPVLAQFGPVQSASG